MNHIIKSDEVKQDMRKAAIRAIDDAADELDELSQDIWSHPELNYKEHYAHALLTSALKKHRFRVKSHYIHDTAFRAWATADDVTSADGPNVALVAEYDALPGIGHACGHNLIAELAVAAGLGLQAALKVGQQRLGRQLGTVTVLGTPAEEGGGGKVLMVRQGGMEGLDCALMAHPAAITSCMANGQACLAFRRGSVEFLGKSSDAAMTPWNGVNALDAAVIAYNSIACLRQQLSSTYKVHVIIKNGTKNPDLIPAKAVLEVTARAPTRSELGQVLIPKLNDCLTAAAQSTGCKVKINIAWSDRTYENIITSPELAERYDKYATVLGVEGTNASVSQVPYSSDMGNVSHVVPSIHPAFYIGATDVINHTRPFAALAGSAVAQPHTLRQAKVLAYIGIDIYLNPHLVMQMKQQLQRDLDEEEKIAQQFAL